MKKILFVCTGNTCRSPMAESILKHMLREKNIDDIQVSSCGIAAIEGQPMSDNAAEALKKMDIKPHEHSSIQYKDSFLDQYSLILTMTKAHKQYIGEHDNVFTLSELTGAEDIPDPYGQQIEVYKNTAEVLYKACKVLLEKTLK